MKFLYAFLCLVILLTSCDPATDNAAKEKFEKNSQTILKYLDGFQNENLDYSIYADDLTMFMTTFGNADSLSLDEVKARNKELWARYDFKFLTDPVVLLQGVNSETNMPDGSVRYYGEWKVTRSATDSTQAKSGQVDFYQTFDFNDEGKIIVQAGYGDVTALMNYINSVDVQ